jgi:nucleoside-diphosphate-sugar epimerase
MNPKDDDVGHDDVLLVTGANGFIGSRVVQALVDLGFRNLRCFIRSGGLSASLANTIQLSPNTKIDTVVGDLASPEDCSRGAKGVTLVFHLAATTEARSFSEAQTRCVDTTRNLLDALLTHGRISRFVHVSSFSVYSTLALRRGALLDESCPTESDPARRGETYCYAKLKQEELVKEYGRRFSMPYIIVRPGAVYGPGSAAITGRVGIRRRGLMLHLGGRNVIPFTYVDNCARAIAMAGVAKHVDGEVINIVDDAALTSREFLRMYQRNVRRVWAVYLPKVVSYALFCLLGILVTFLGKSTSTYNRRRWAAYWKGNKYTNQKAKLLIGWTPHVPMDVGMKRYFEYCRAEEALDA